MSAPSIKLGPVVSIGGVRVPVHKALRQLLCAECGAVIAPHELFTRWPLTGAPHLYVMPKGECCAPFTLPVAETSPLLQLLLSQTDTPAAPAPRTISDETRQALNARLGPALARKRSK